MLILVKHFWAKSMSGNYQLMNIRKWVFNQLDPGCFDSIGKFFHTYCLPLHTCWVYFEDKLLPPLLGFYRMASVMLDLWKDFVFYFALQNYTSFRGVSIYFLL